MKKTEVISITLASYAKMSKWNNYNTFQEEMEKMVF